MDIIRFHLLMFCLLGLFTVKAQLRRNYCSKTCPNVESIVQSAVTAQFNQGFLLRLCQLSVFFVDCFVQGCDASILILSTPTNTAERDHPDILSLAGDGFDTVIKAKEAVEAKCKNTVSCADILAMTTRDDVALAGGPAYPVELGRLDGLKSTAVSVNGKLPQPGFNLSQLNAIFGANGLSQADMIALSGAHTLGFPHCEQFPNRNYNFFKSSPVDPTLNKAYATQLQSDCPRIVDPDIAFSMDPVTPRTIDNQYYKNLQSGKGLVNSDQSLFTDTRYRPTVNIWAGNSTTFQQAFVTAMTKLGRVGVKTGDQGNIGRNCTIFN